jgi:Protein of unknown function (DUF3386)
MSKTLTAQELFRNAYDNRYTWDAKFPGYEADVTMTTGDVTHTAKVRINEDLKFEVEGIEDENVLRAIQGQLWEMTIHRVNHSFEKTHGENTFSFGETDENGVKEILLGGASLGNSYKIKDNTVCFVNRKIGNKIVNINTFKTMMTDKGYLAQGYDSIYLDPETKQTLGTKTIFEDNFEKFGDYYILTNRTIHNEPETTEFSFSNIQLLN